MNVLYCSTVNSVKTLEEISKKLNYPLTSITTQKFHRLILRGLVFNGTSIQTVSTIPVRRRFNHEKSCVEDGIEYQYLTTIEYPILRHICIVLNSFFKMLKWYFSTKGKHVVICDVLNISICMGILLGRFLGMKVVGLMTDMPGLMVDGCKKSSFLSSVVRNVNMYLLKHFDAYVFLTEAMNDKINVKHKPYIVIEGLVDINMKAKERLYHSSSTRKLIYAGGIYKKYGVDMLINAFRKVKGENLKLCIYGRIGNDMPYTMDEYHQMDNRFSYLGIKPNEEIVEAELTAALLVNPRPTHEEFTKYSFPSKNMEYMVSGTPVLTMALPGMPVEYYDKLFVCTDETEEGLTKKITEIMSLSQQELNALGEKGRNFVLEQKNNIVQAKRILELINKI